MSAFPKMKISIITVCFNSEKTIEKTIQSVISQTYQDIEYIIIDGKSTDKTLGIAEKYRSHITQLISESDGGVYEAMNKGLQIATGEVICFLNSDDIYASKRTLEYVANTFISKKIDAFFGGISFFHGHNPSKIYRTYRYDQFNLKKFTYGFMPAHPATFIKKTLADANGKFDIRYRIAGDYDYLLRMFKNIKFKYECTKNILVMMQSGGVSNNGIYSKILLNQEILNSAKKNNLNTNLFKIYSRYLTKIFEFI